MDESRGRDPDDLRTIVATDGDVADGAVVDYVLAKGSAARNEGEDNQSKMNISSINAPVTIFFIIAITSVIRL